MKKITLKNTSGENTLIINEGLFYSLENKLKNYIENVTEATPEEKQSSFYYTYDNNKNINFFKVLNDNQKYYEYSKLLSWKMFKMYNYRITVKRHGNFSSSDFEIIMKNQNNIFDSYKFYFYNIEI